jgi:probable phosphoglycerate mutase
VPDDTTEYAQRPFTPPPGASQLLLVRHGASAPFRVGEDFTLVDGHGDPPLDPIGHQEAELVAERLSGENIAAIYVTSLQRTVQTAAPLAARLGIEPIVEPDLREVLLGEWEGGMFRKHVAEGHPIAIQMMTEQRWDVIPGAETSETFETRIVKAVERIAERHVDEFVVVFTHGAVIAQLLAHATGARRFSFLSDNASISHLVVHEGHWLVRRYNDTTHLHAAFTTAAEPMT